MYGRLPRGEDGIRLVSVFRPRADGRRSKRNISLFMAMSLDGYIADGQGGVDRLQGQGNDDEMVDSYSSCSTPGPIPA